MATLRDIDFLLYNRAAGSEPDAALTDEHWSYMDQFADAWWRVARRSPPTE